MPPPGRRLVAPHLCVAAAVLAAAGASPLRPGVWSWACGYAGYEGSQPAGFYQNLCFEQVLGSAPPPPELQGWFLLIYWRDLEPQPGVFNWTVFDTNLTKAAANGLQVQPVVYIYDGATPMPDWMENYSKPIMFRRGGATGHLERAPNFLDPAFQRRWQLVIEALAAHLDTGLTPAARECIWAVQAVAGITGDNRPWNGVPESPRDAINASSWMEYSRMVADMYIDAFVPTGIPVIANLHEGFSGQEDQGWFLERAWAKGMRGAAIKEGTPSHWYGGNGERDLFARESPLLLAPQPDGVSYARARGELAVEPDPTAGTYGNWAHSPWWSLQANAESYLTFGGDVWNLYAGFLGNTTFAPTMAFFNRHAGHRDPTLATAAFISFRDSLDTADVDRWPVADYGPVNSTENPAGYANLTRMELVAAAHAARGASLGDSPGGASAKSSVHQKKAMCLYDVCWMCFRGNYGRYLIQLDPLNTSVGWWQVGPRDQPWGRYARGLEHSSGKISIQVQLDPSFGAAVRRAGRCNAMVRVVYLDRGRGRWALHYNGAVAGSVRKQDSGDWQIANLNITLPCSSQLPRQPGGGLLTLTSLDGQDDVFSLLEVLLR